MASIIRLYPDGTATLIKCDPWVTWETRTERERLSETAASTLNPGRNSLLVNAVANIIDIRWWQWGRRQSSWVGARTGSAAEEEKDDKIDDAATLWLLNQFEFCRFVEYIHFYYYITILLIDLN